MKQSNIQEDENVLNGDMDEINEEQFQEDENA
jgi:hypothetical protein